MRIDVLGVGFDNLTMTEAVSHGAALLEEPGCHYVVTPNPEIVEVCRENPTAMQAVNGADLVLPDGIGVVKGAAMLGTPLKEKTPGIEFAAGLMEKMAERGRSLYLLGAKPGVADMAAERLQKQYPGLKIAGTHDGYFKEDALVVEAIRESGIAVVENGAVRAEDPLRTACSSVWGPPSRSCGWRGTAPPPAPICCAASAEVWTYSRAPWSVRRNSGPITAWNGFTACVRSRSASAG